jgi:hypothetical protein
MGYGRQGLGVVSANNTGVLTITAGSWCAAMWMTLKGAKLEAFTSGGTQHNGDLTVSAVSIANKTVTVTGTSTSVAADDILFLKGHRANSPYGLMDIAKNGGTLYNISASDYELWAANHYDVGTSALTLGKILVAAAMAANKGCADPLTCLVPVESFQALVNDQSQLIRFNASASTKAESGFDAITVRGATGKIEIVPYMFCKEGEFVMFPERYSYLIGSEEMTNQPGDEGDIWMTVPDSNSKEIRWYGEWTVFCEKPGYIVYGTRSDGLALHT